VIDHVVDLVRIHATRPQPAAHLGDCALLLLESLEGQWERLVTH